MAALVSLHRLHLDQKRHICVIVWPNRFIYIVLRKFLCFNISDAIRKRQVSSFVQIDHAHDKNGYQG